MNIDSLSVYVGPNVHAREAVIRLELDVRPSYAESLKGLGADVIDRLAAVLPGLAREQAEWLAALRAGEALSVGDLVGKLALALQHAAGIDGTLAWSGSTGDPDVVEVFYSYSNEDIGVEAGEVACDMLAAIARADAGTSRLGQGRSDAPADRGRQRAAIAVTDDRTRRLVDSTTRRLRQSWLRGGHRRWTGEPRWRRGRRPARDGPRRRWLERFGRLERRGIR